MNSDFSSPTNKQTPSSKISRLSKRYVALALVGVLVVASFIGGVAVDQRFALGKKLGLGRLYNQNAPAPYALKDVDFSGFWDVWQMVKTQYVRQPVTDMKLFYGATRGIVESLGDPYSDYFDPETAQKFNQELSGTFSGIGAEIGVKKNLLTIIAPLPGTPAERAGLQAGDVVVTIDGTDTSGLSVDEAVTKIRGVKGTPVKLLMFREGWKEPKEITIIRDTIVVESVKSSISTVNGKKIAVITITQFNEVAQSKFSGVVRGVVLQNPDGIVLDLRNDPGGYLETAVKVASEWIASGTNIVSEKSSEGKVKTHPANGISRLANIKTVVLINGGSASASEIVAGALQDYGKAYLIGEKSFGKGSVQNYIEFDDGSALKLTIALWYTPKDRSIDKEGILPDEVVKRTSDDIENNNDPQMDAAVKYLTGAPAPKTTKTNTNKK